MKKRIIEEFEGGRIWDHCIESANELVAEYIKSIGGDEPMVEDILGIICESDTPLNEWDGHKIIRLVEDYVDR